MPTTGCHAMSFDFHDPAFQTDPWPLYEWYRQNQPVHWSESAKSYVVVGYEQVRHTLTSDQFGVFHPFRTSRRAFGPSMLDSEGPTHAHARRAAGSVLRPRAVPGIASQIIAPIANRLLDRLVNDGATDLAYHLARELPMRVICRLMGLPESDARWLYEAIRPLVRYVDHDTIALAEVARQRQELRAYLADVTDHGSNGMLAALAAEPALSEADVTNNALLLLAAGTETTSAAITNLLARLAGEPTLFRTLAADRSKLPAAVAETLRHQPPLHVTLRFAARQLTLAETELPAGAPVQVVLASANRDPTIYPEPSVWQPRAAGRSPLSFGAGRHACLGMVLALAELEVVLGALLDRVDELELACPPPPIRGRTFRYTADLRLAFRPRHRDGRS